MSIRTSLTAVIERNTVWQGTFASEPYETAWASEAIFFIRALRLDDAGESLGTAQVQISPDGIHWCDEGTCIALPRQTDEVTFVRVAHFGGWLRLAGSTADDRLITVIVSLSLKE